MIDSPILSQESNPSIQYGINQLIPDNLQVFSTHLDNSSETILPALQLPFQGKDEDRHYLTTVIDTCSSGTFLNVSCLNYIHYRILKRSVPIMVNTLNGNETKNVQEIQIYMKPPNVLSTDITPIKAYVLDEILTIPHINFPPHTLGKLKQCGIKESFIPKQQCDILLSMQHATHVLANDTRMSHISNDLMVINTIYGPIPCGAINSINKESNYVETTYLSKEENLTKALEKQFILDNFPTDNMEKYTENELFAMEEIKRVLSHDTIEKRFTTSLIFKKDQVPLKNNYYIAKSRLHSYLKKIKPDKPLIQAIDDVINSYIEQGIIKEVKINDVTNKDRTDLFFLPWRCLVRMDKSTSRYRIIFDGSSKNGDKLSLNSQLETGPNFLPHLLDLVLLNQQGKIFGYADISAMYRNIKLTEPSTKKLLFLYANPESPEKIKIFAQLRVSFGTKDSPFVAQSCIKFLATLVQNGSKWSKNHKQTASILQESTYMDDIVVNADTNTEFKEKRKALTEILQEVSFPLHKWVSNSNEVLRSIPENERAPASEIEGKLISNTTSFLGYRYQPKNDTFIFDRYTDMAKDINFSKISKTEICSNQSKIFDVKGFLIPFVTHIKLILKDCHKRNFKWKQILPQDLVKRFKIWTEKLPQLSKLSFPRHMPITENTIFCVFSDATPECISAVVYARTFIPGRNQYRVQFVLAKSRLTPLSQDRSLAQMELAALLYSTIISKYLQKLYNHPTENFVLFTDSLIAKYWSLNNANHLITYNSNRVKIVQDSKFTVHHIKNPHNFSADLICRGTLDLSKLQSSEYLEGPKFLKDSRLLWPYTLIPKDFKTSEGFKKDFTFNVQSNIEHPANIHVYNTKIHVTAVGEEIDVGLKEFDLTVPKSLLETPKDYFITLPHRSKPENRIKLHQYFADLPTLLTKLRTYLFLLAKWKAKVQNLPTPKRFDQIFYTKAINYLIKIHQCENFALDYTMLSTGKNLPKRSRLRNWTPFYDKNNQIIRVGGRMKYGPENMPHDMRFPPIIAGSSSLAGQLMIADHIHNKHSPAKSVHLSLRKKYFILNSMTYCKKAIRACLPCAKFNCQRGRQLMAPLPKQRFDCQLFANTAVDLTSTFDTVDYIKMPQPDGTKRWTKIPGKACLAIWSCLATRYIFVSVLDNESFEAFFNAWLIFKSYFGTPRFLYSDNGSQFLALRRRLLETLEKKAQKDPSLLDYQFEWKTAAPKDAMGCYERPLGLVKHALQKTMKGAKLAKPELAALVAQIAASLNQRALSEVNADDFQALTPSHLAYGRELNPHPYDRLPDETHLTSGKLKTDFRNRWRHRTELHKHFQNAFFNQHLLELQSRSKWKEEQPNIKINQLCLLHLEKEKKANFPLCRIVEIYKSPDGKVRSCLLKTPTEYKTLKYLKRAVKHIYPLELDVQAQPQKIVPHFQTPKVPQKVPYLDLIKPIEKRKITEETENEPLSHFRKKIFYGKNRTIAKPSRTKTKADLHLHTTKQLKIPKKRGRPKLLNNPKIKEQAIQLTPPVKQRVSFHRTPSQSNIHQMKTRNKK